MLRKSIEQTEPGHHFSFPPLDDLIPTYPTLPILKKHQVILCHLQPFAKAHLPTDLSQMPSLYVDWL